MTITERRPIVLLPLGEGGERSETDEGRRAHPTALIRPSATFSQREKGLLQKSPVADRRRGQSLVEFAIVALMMYLMLAAIVEFGRIYFGAETIQSTVDLAAREFARVPAPPDLTISEGLDQQTIFQSIYDERFLVIDIQQAEQQSPDGTIVGYVNQNFPIVNRQLFPLMHYVEVGNQSGGSSGQTKKLLAYPGILIADPHTDTAPAGAINDGYVVRVPLVINRSGTNGAETIVIHRVLEAVTPTADTYPLFNDDGMSVVNGGMAALRLNYPFQAATMSSYPWDPANPNALHVLDPNVADDNKNSAGGTDVSVQDPLGLLGTGPVAPGFSPVYEGEYSLGERQAVGKVVRPFRKTISCQAVYRREVYGAATTSGT